MKRCNDDNKGKIWLVLYFSIIAEKANILKSQNCSSFPLLLSERGLPGLPFAYSLYCMFQNCRWSSRVFSIKKFVFSKAIFSIPYHFICDYVVDYIKRPWNLPYIQSYIGTHRSSICCKLSFETNGLVQMNTVKELIALLRTNFVLLRENFANVALLKVMDCVLDFQIRIIFTYDVLMHT